MLADEPEDAALHELAACLKPLIAHRLWHTQIVVVAHRLNGWSP